MPDQTVSLPELAQWLQEPQRPANTLNLHQLQGFLFAICSTPVKLQQREWMPAVFADQLSLIDQEADVYLNTINQLQQHIAQDIDDFMVCLPEDCILTEPFAANFESNALHHWSHGFELGLTLTEHFWDVVKDAAQPQSFWAMLSFFSNLHNAQTLTAKFKNGSLPIETVTLSVFSEFSKLMQNYADLAKKHQQPRKGQGVRLSAGAATNSAGIPLFNQQQPMQDNNTLIQQAWASPDPIEKVQLAHQVLQQDPDNINALMLLAQWEAASSEERRDLLKRAVEGCERVLGEEFFAKNSGRFWLIRETRTFMEALTNLASSYAHLGDYANAIACYERGIILNPADNQFNRYPLSNCYITTRQLDKARALARQFAQDTGAFFLFDQALCEFIEQGDSSDSRQLKQQALAHNKYVPKVLTGKIKMPKRMPERLGSGDKDEAVLYAAQNTELWRGVPGAIAWLLKK